MRIAEITITVPGGRRAEAERLAYAAGAQGLEVRDADTGLRDRVQIVWWAPLSVRRAILRMVRAKGVEVAARVVEASWMPAPRARNLGTRFVVVGPDDGRARVRGRVALPLEASLGFGDGLHPTTALCVEAMERLAIPTSVLDVGTGTGVLAIVAARLGAERVVATDVDPLAREAARGNLVRCGVSAKLRADLPGGRFGLVVSNLYFEPLLGLLPELTARAGTLVVSGFGLGSSPTVAARIRELGLSPARARTRAGFACITATRPPSR